MSVFLHTDSLHQMTPSVRTGQTREPSRACTPKPVIFLVPILSGVIQHAEYFVLRAVALFSTGSDGQQEPKGLFQGTATQQVVPYTRPRQFMFFKSDPKRV